MLSNALEEFSKERPMADVPPHVMALGEPQTRRWVEQRWLVDNVIRANGIDWDQPRTIYLNAACGLEAAPDFVAIRARVQKYADISPAFEAAARRRQAKAEDAERAGNTVTARDNYFIAAIHWAGAQWPIDEANETNIFYNTRKRACYAAFAARADRRVEAAWIPFQGKSLPAWFHLPPDYRANDRKEKIPAAVVMQGMDGCKEAAVALYGDKFLSRGIAVLAFDGPGSYESPLLGIHTSVPNWQEAAHAVYEWLAARPEIDATRIAISGASFASFFGTLVAAAEPRFACFAVYGTCTEPGAHTIFEEASPTFKQRFMFMSGIRDEAKFDEFRKTLTWEGHAEKIRMPYLLLAGEADELSPLKHTEGLFRTLDCPRTLVVYQDARHAIGGVPSATLGPSVPSVVADWVAARFAGKALTSERWYVDAAGRVSKTALS
jgi:dienelactone hydrolase